MRIYSGMVKRKRKRKRKRERGVDGGQEENEDEAAASSNDRSCLLCPDCFTLEPIISGLFQWILFMGLCRISHSLVFSLHFQRQRTPCVLPRPLKETRARPFPNFPFRISNFALEKAWLAITQPCIMMPVSHVKMRWAICSF